MNGLSLCSGIGGLDLGLHLAVPGYRTVCYVEKEAFCQDILLTRMADGVLDRAPIYGDLKCFDGNPWHGLIDMVHGGYPCQPFSVAGKRGGANDPRHLWPSVARIIAEVRPEYVFLENVAGHLTLGFDRVVCELEYRDYEVAAGLFTAAEVGAPHRRQRLYILARRREGNGMADAGCFGHNTDKSRWTGGPSRAATTGTGGSRATVGHANDPRLEGWREPERESPDEWAAWPPSPEERAEWERVSDALKPAIRGVAHGLPRRVDRLKALGNAVVPDVAALAWRHLYGELNG